MSLRYKNIVLFFLLFGSILSYSSYKDLSCKLSFSNLKRGLTKSSPKKTEKLLSPRKHRKKVQASHKLVKKSVWKIQGEREFGSGFFISHNQFITTYHLMLSMNPDLSNTYLSQKDSSQRIKVKRILALSALHDLALLETVQSSKVYLQAAERSPQSEETLFVAGYANSQFQQLRKISRRILSSKDEYSFLVSGFNLDLPGMSGSPVYDEGGRIKGVANSVVTGATSTLISTSLDSLQRFIEESERLNCQDWTCIGEEIRKLQLLAEKGELLAQFRLASMYRGKNGNEQEIFYLFQQAAKQKHLFAQSALAALYYEGRGVKKDIRKALYWFREAAKQGHPSAQFTLAEMYRRGNGVKADVDQALYWFREAAENGHTSARVTLAFIYNKGEEVKADPEQARYWFEKAESGM